MATREIKTRFKLEGEQEYNRAMTEAASAIKVLNAEQKLAKAQYENTGDAQQYAADQARILKEQIEQQKKAVEAAEKAVKNLTENGVDKNAQEMQKWRTKLANARTTLTGMQTRLKNVTSELGEEKKSFNNAEGAGSTYQDQMEKVNQGIDFQNTITAIDNITGHIEKIVKGAAKAAKALWEMGVDAGAWADNIATAASQAGLDPETYQSWQYASRFIDTSVDDIVKNWKDIDSKLVEDGETKTNYLADLAKVGVASMNQVSGSIRNGSDIFFDLIDYLHGISDAETQATEATKFFGNDWRKLYPLITAGSKAYKEMAAEGMSVAVVSNENVAALGAVDDAAQDMGARFDKLKYDTLAALAPMFEQTAKALSTAITAMDEFVQSEEGQAALAGLNEALSGLISSFLGEDNGKGTFEAIVSGAKGAVEGFTSAMNWIKDHGDAVAATVAGLAAAWAGLKVTKEVLTFAQLLSGHGSGGGLISRLFGGKQAAAEGLDSITQSFSETANSFSSSADAAKSAADAAKSSAEAAKSSADAAGSSTDAAKGSADASKGSADASKGSADASKSSSGAAKSSADASKSSATASKGSADAAKSSADAAKSSAEASSAASSAAESSATAINEAASSAGSSAASAASSAQGAAQARAALEAGSAGALESSAAASAARIEAETAARLANEAANRALLNSGSSNLLSAGSDDFIKRLMNNVKIQFRIPVGGSGGNPLLNGGPSFPALPGGSGQASLPAGSGAGAAVQLTGWMAGLEKLLTLGASTGAKLGGGLGLGLYVATRETPTASDDLDSLWDAYGNPTTAGREAGITWRQSEDSPERWAQMYQESDAAKAAAEAEQALADARAAADKEAAKEQAAQDYWDALLSGDQKEINAATEKLFDLMGGYSDEWTAFQQKLEGWMSDDINWDPPEDLPKEWFSSAEETVTGVDGTLSGGMEAAGENAAIGLANGIDRQAHQAIQAAANMAAGVSAAVRNTMVIQSPSHVMDQYGQYISLGLAGGIDRQVGAVDRAVGHMISAVTRPVAAMDAAAPAFAAGQAVAVSGQPASGAAQPVIQATIVMDKRVVGEMVAPVVNETIGAVVSAERE